MKVSVHSNDIVNTLRPVIIQNVVRLQKKITNTDERNLCSVKVFQKTLFN